MGSLPRVAGACELLDAPARLPDLEACLRDVARLNRFPGGARMTLAQVTRLLGQTPRARPVWILDVGTGGADLPMALVRWARQCGRPIRVLALDRNDRILAIARRFAAHYPEIVFLLGDARFLPVKAESLDVALAALTLHHLEPSEAPGVLAELGRVTRLGFIVNDLIRSRVAYWLVWLATRLLARSPLSHHDGPLSVLRAYTPAEIRDLARRAGLERIRIRTYPWLARLVAVVERNGPAHR